MATGSRREREKEDIQRRILDAARDLFASEGYEAVTMRKIADRVDYTPTALYFHFKDKHELVRKLCADDFGALSARFRVLSRVPDPVERLRMLGRGYIAFALEHPHHYRLMFMTPRFEPEEPASEGEHPDRGVHGFFFQAVSEAIAAGRLRPGFTDPHLVAQTLWAGAHGVASLAIARRHGAEVDWRPIEERAGVMIDALLRGLAPEE
jgi:AcrR family transcriptional regulator